MVLIDYEKFRFFPWVLRMICKSLAFVWSSEISRIAFQDKSIYVYAFVYG